MAAPTRVYLEALADGRPLPPDPDQDVQVRALERLGLAITFAPAEDSPAFLGLTGPGWRLVNRWRQQDRS